jgi:hypothetical protein
VGRSLLAGSAVWSRLAVPFVRCVSAGGSTWGRSSGRLVLRARGRCWLSIRADSAAGPVLYEATLEAGGILRYTLAPGRPRLWLRIGAPWNLELSLNGKPDTALPPGPGNVLVERSGVRSA